MTDLIRAAKLWAKTGATYYVGRMGGCRVLVLENRDRKGEDEPTHWLMLGDAEAGQERPQARPERRPQSPLPGDAPANRSARPVEPGPGWRGSEYRRPPRDGARRALAADGGALVEDGVDDLYR
jgi:hypothetical protein